VPRQGYRLFVDRLSTVKADVVADRTAIETFLEAGRPRRRGAPQRSLLAQLTLPGGGVQYPTLSRA